MHRARDARRRRLDQVAALLVRGAGYISVLVLVGIFLLLGVRAGQTFGGGIETQPLTEAERAALDPEIVAALVDRPEPPSPAHFFGGREWRPDAYRTSSYGILALLAATLLTTAGAMAIAIPIGLIAAAWPTFVAQGRLRDGMKYGIELVAAVPSVVIGFLGLQLIGPALGRAFDRPGGLSALNGSILLAVMALPTIISLSEDAFRAVPRAMIDGSLALGGDRWQTLVHVAIPAARSGLFAAAMLGMGRAIGETMTVLMATGNVAQIPTSWLDPVQTMTATIAIELGEVARGTTHYFALFAVGLLLFLVTLGINLAADAVQRRQERLLRGS
ncbi:MAG: phosphate ABC transporter permease subunit PstC [Myxococcota bacterium]